MTGGGVSRTAHALLRQPGGESLLFAAPEAAVIAAHAPAQVEQAIERMQRALDAGQVLAVALSYELGHVLATPPLPCPRKPHAPVPRPPLIWALPVEEAARLDTAGTAAFLRRRAMEDARRFTPAAATRMPEPLLDAAGFAQAFRRIQDYIAAGDTYQINLTFPVAFATRRHPALLHAALLRQQPAPHAAFLEMAATDGASLWVASASPELFLELDSEGGMHTRPMKGTAARHADAARDAAAARALRGDAKTRAENLMITDLMRNDFGRIAEVGSVRVPALHVVESYPTVHQMVSEVRARMRPGLCLRDMLAALLPAGSITGAPKRRAMEIIDELEDHARGLYTGNIGWLRKGANGHYEGVLSVVIRTALVDARGHGRMGIGAGIVADSRAQAEYAECLLKAQFLHGALREEEAG